MGKGDKRRPTHVDEETFAERWARTFGEGAGQQAIAEGADDPSTETRQPAPDPDINPSVWEQAFGGGDEEGERPDTPVTDAIREVLPNATSMFDLWRDK